MSHSPLNAVLLLPVFLFHVPLWLTQKCTYIFHLFIDLLFSYLKCPSYSLWQHRYDVKSVVAGCCGSETDLLIGSICCWRALDKACSNVVARAKGFESKRTTK